MARVFLTPGYYADPVTDKAIASGYIYVGERDKAPQDFPITVTALQEDGNTVAIAQPIRTGVGGAPTYNGSTVSLFVDESDYSLQVLRSDLTQAYLIPRTSDSSDTDGFSLPVWDSAVTYAENEQVTGSDGLGYRAIAGSGPPGASVDPVADGPVGSTWIEIGYSRVISVTVSGTYEYPEGLRRLKGETVAGGGAGGGAITANGSFGGGGGGGGTAIFLVDVSELASPETTTVGAGGTGSNGDGGDGGTTSFGSLASAAGGSGGRQDDDATGAAGGSGGGGTIGDELYEGGDGDHSSADGLTSGRGGSSSVGGGGGSRQNDGSAARPGGNYGGGGGGGVRRTINGVGGDGADGVINLTEFF